MPGQAPRARWEELAETGGPAARSLALRGGDGRAGVMPAWRNIGGTPSVSMALGAAPAPPPWAVVLTPHPPAALRPPRVPSSWRSELFLNAADGAGPSTQLLGLQQSPNAYRACWAREGPAWRNAPEPPAWFILQSPPGGKFSPSPG